MLTDVFFAKAKRNRQSPYTYEAIKRIFARAGCKLLTKNYKNNKQLLTYKCSCGEKSVAPYNNFYRALNNCRNCYNLKIGKKLKENYQKNYIT